jgi:hypothetical protein
MKGVNDMPDISMCYGINCPMKHKCYRCIAPPNPYRQAYADFETIRGEDGICKYFWDISLSDDIADNGFNLIDKNGGNT